MSKTASDYLKEIKELSDKTTSVKARLKSKLLIMSKHFPEAIIVREGDIGLKAKGLTPEHIDRLTVQIQIVYLDAIERYSDQIQRKRQTSILDN